jgi:hypothetical protein
MLEDLSDRAVQGPEKAREEAAMWLARLDRGLRADEAPPLRDWLKDRVNRNIILDMARLWHGPSSAMRASGVHSRASVWPGGPTRATHASHPSLRRSLFRHALSATPAARVG